MEYKIQRLPNEPTDAASCNSAASANPASDFKTQIEDDGVVIVKFLDANATSVAVPAQIDGRPVVIIARYAFACCNSLTSVEIPASVKEIGYNAFAERAADLTLYGAADSVAEAYAAENGLRFEAR